VEQPAIRFVVYRHLAGHVQETENICLMLICISAFAALANLGDVSVIIIYLH